MFGLSMLFDAESPFRPLKTLLTSALPLCSDHVGTRASGMPIELATAFLNEFRRFPAKMTLGRVSASPYGAVRRG
jgi:hypothetical protein